MKGLVVPLIQLIAVLFGAFSGFLTNVAPPEEPGKVGVKFAVGVSSFLTLALFLLMATLQRKFGGRSALIWIGSGVLFLVLAAPLAYLYGRDYDRVVIGYPPGDEEVTLYVIGSQLTEPAQSLRDLLGNEQATDQFLMRKFGGEPTDVWTTDSIQENRMSLTVLYVTFVIVMLLAVMCLAQAAQPSKSAARNANQPPPVP